MIPWMWALSVIVADSIVLPHCNEVFCAFSFVFLDIILWALAWGNMWKHISSNAIIIFEPDVLFLIMYMCLWTCFFLSSMMSGAFERSSRWRSSLFSVRGTCSKGQRGCCQGRDLALSALAHRSVLYGLSQESRHQVEECMFLCVNMCRIRFGIRSCFRVYFGYLFRHRLRDQNRTTPRWNATVRFIVVSSLSGP